MSHKPKSHFHTSPCAFSGKLHPHFMQPRPLRCSQPPQISIRLVYSSSLTVLNPETPKRKRDSAKNAAFLASDGGSVAGSSFLQQYHLTGFSHL